MSCPKHTVKEVCWQCVREQADALGAEFKRRYCISAKIERQIVAMSNHVPPAPGEDANDWLERLYRAWYAANQ